MDPVRFDALTRALSTLGHRRALLGLLPTLPAFGGLLAFLGADDAEAKGRRKRRKKRHKHGKGNGRHRKGKRNRNRCKAKSHAKICAGKCGIVKNKQTCKKKIDCGACACDPPCPACQLCDGSGQCQPDAAREGQPCGAPGEECQDGVCVQTCLPPTADLQTAIDATPAGSELVLCAGTWRLEATVRITQDLTLRGVGAEQTRLDGQETVKVLTIAVGATVTLQALTVTRGRATFGGGIDNSGTLTLRDMAVKGNTAQFQGGGINNTGTLTLQAGSRVTGNTATGPGGGIRNTGTLILEEGSRVAGNTANDGGGIYNSSGTLILKTGSVVGGDDPADANTATNNGGGIINFGMLILEEGSRVMGNTATSAGGGIFSLGGTVDVQANAFVCDNLPAGDQCGLVTIDNCPNPPSGDCSG